MKTYDLPNNKYSMSFKDRRKCNFVFWTVNGFVEQKDKETDFLKH